jgi:hypothetical protein
VGLGCREPFIPDGDFEAFVEKGQLTQAVGEGVEVIGSRFEDGSVGLPADYCAPFLAGPGVRQGGRLDFVGGSVGDADFVALGVDFAVQVDKGLAPFGEGVYDRYADAVEAARYFIGIFVKLAACVEAGHNELKGADAFARMDIHRDTAAVVFNTDYVVAFEDHEDIVAEALHGFVY